MGNLFDQSGDQIRCGEIIVLNNIVEKWVDNLAEKIRWNNWVEKLSLTSL